ncbi:hypothetical protein ACFROC_00180 [Nocardia tengchongensis]|uniref:hypothetical protein n=1 Tax=Nocardia tengchongensis TaxID=2055889 RepID=UPI0036942832
MTRDRLFRFVHVTGHACWWIFVVATLWPETTRYGWTAYGLSEAPRRYADYQPSDGFCMATPVAGLAFLVLIIAATVEAAAVGRLIPGLVTVFVPFSAAIVIWSVAPGGCGGHADTAVFPALAIVLLAVAAREVWARAFAPHPSS